MTDTKQVKIAFKVADLERIQAAADRAGLSSMAAWVRMKTLEALRAEERVVLQPDTETR